MGALISLIAVAALTGLAWLAVAVGDLRYLVGVVFPGVAFAVFIIGIVVRVVRWARSPVPFRIPTVSGQQKTLPWIKHDELESPSGAPGVVGRMLLEVLFFRSLFRNTKVHIDPIREKVSYFGAGALWLAAMLFHWSMLVIILRHFRFLVEPTPLFVEWIQAVDGFFQIGLPILYLSTLAFLAGLAWLLARRLVDAKVRYISLPSDYFALYLLLGIGLSGVAMRHLEKVDVVQVKAAIAGWTSFAPVLPEGVGVMYFLHVALVSALLVYFPFSKLLHAPGIFLSPTRNLANNNRAKRHVNPWNPPIVGHTYAEWEEEFHDKVVAAGYTLDKE